LIDIQTAKEADMTVWAKFIKKSMGRIEGSLRESHYLPEIYNAAEREYLSSDRDRTPPNISNLLSQMRTLVMNDQHYQVTFVIPFGIRTLFTKEMEKAIEEKGVLELIRALNDEDGSRRAAAAILLSMIPHKAKESIPVLFGNLRDENVYVRRSAAIALGKIGTENYIPAYYSKQKEVVPI